MKILIADDDPVTCCRLEDRLTHWGHQAVVVSDGIQARQLLQTPNAPEMALLDWVMPGMEGPTICREIRAAGTPLPPYLILLTAKGDKQDVVLGLTSGADDYVAKPFDDDELFARIQVGLRTLALEKSLAQRVAELERSLSQVKLLRGLLPICSYCKKIRNDQSYWQQVEAYIVAHSEAEFSHTVCPDCYEKHVRPEFEKFLGPDHPGLEYAHLVNQPLPHASSADSG
jgi:CheY-like chemotaxis protein